MTALGLPSPTPHDALAAFVRDGWRDSLIRELVAGWSALGRSEVEDAVDEALADAARSMRATGDRAVYDYVRTATQRILTRRKTRSARAGAPVVRDLDFDRMVGETLGPDDALIAKEHRQLIIDIAASLDERSRAVLRLKYVDGLERKQVAGALGVSEKSVKKALERAHRICRDLYSADGGAELCGGRRGAINALITGSDDARLRAEAEAHLAHCLPCRRYHRAFVVARRAAAIAPLPALPGSGGGVLAGAVRALAARFAEAIASGSSAPVAKLAVVTALASGAAYGTDAALSSSAPAAHRTPARATRTHTAPAATVTVSSGAPDPVIVQTPARPRHAHPHKRAKLHHERATTDRTPPKAPAAPSSAPSAPASPPAPSEFPIF